MTPAPSAICLIVIFSKGFSTASFFRLCASSLSTSLLSCKKNLHVFPRFSPVRRGVPVLLYASQYFFVLSLLCISLCLYVLLSDSQSFSVILCDSLHFSKQLFPTVLSDSLRFSKQLFPTVLSDSLHFSKQLFPTDFQSHQNIRVSEYQSGLSQAPVRRQLGNTYLYSFSIIHIISKNAPSKYCPRNLSPSHMRNNRQNLTRSHSGSSCGITRRITPV